MHSRSLLLAACLLASSLPTQEPKSEKRLNRKSNQNTFERQTEPGAGQKFLARFQGDWTVTKIFYPRQGDPVRSTGTCRQTMIHAGRFLQSDFTFTQDGHSSTGTGVIGFEPHSGTFTSFWTDSRQTRMSIRHSQDEFDGQKIILYSRSLEASNKDARRSKTISSLEPDGKKLIHRQYALDPTGEERLQMELIMIKR